jgi:hypothetical protein
METTRTFPLNAAASPLSTRMLQKLFANLRTSNHRIRLNDVLNRCCALGLVLESILLILVVKIVLQHILPDSGHRHLGTLCHKSADVRSPKRGRPVARLLSKTAGALRARETLSGKAHIVKVSEAIRIILTRRLGVWLSRLF